MARDSLVHSIHNNLFTWGRGGPFTPVVSKPGCRVRNESDPSPSGMCSRKGKSGCGLPASVAGNLLVRSLQATLPRSEGRANHPSSPPHLSHVSLGLSNLTESNKLFISVPPSLGHGGCPLLNAVPQGSSQRCEAVVQPEGHLLRSFLSGLAGAWAAESPGHKEVPSKEASPHQYGRHTHDVPHGQHRAAPCHREICGGMPERSAHSRERLGLSQISSPRDSSELNSFH